MLIGIILGFTLGIILLLIGFIAMITGKKKSTSKQWPGWVLLAGIAAILTATFNMIMLY